MNSGRILLRRDRLEALTKMNAIIFDCDGVLIDVRNSYTKTTTETLLYFIRELFGVDLKPNNSFLKLIHLFKKSGGFNNEWSITYSILLQFFCQLPKTLQQKFIKTVKQFNHQTLLERFYKTRKTVKNQLRPQDIYAWFNSNELYLLAKNATSLGTKSIERIFNNSPNSKEIYKATKHFLSYPGWVGESLLTTIFEEIFCGETLFKQLYEAKAQFYLGKGLINMEKKILTSKILEDLTDLIGNNNFGIATGRPYLLTRHTLGKLLDRFKKDAAIFIEHVIEAEQTNRKKNIETNLKKPNPFSLIKSAESLEPFNKVLYIGDSAEDVLMVKKACKFDKRFLSIGVYSTSFFKKDLMSHFIKMETDAILPSINELAGLIKSLRRNL